MHIKIQIKMYSYTLNFVGFRLLLQSISNMLSYVENELTTPWQKYKRLKHKKSVYKTQHENYRITYSPAITILICKEESLYKNKYQKCIPQLSRFTFHNSKGKHIGRVVVVYDMFKAIVFIFFSFFFMYTSCSL